MYQAYPLLQCPLLPTQSRRFLSRALGLYKSLRVVRQRAVTNGGAGVSGLTSRIAASCSAATTIPSMTGSARRFLNSNPVYAGVSGRSARARGRTYHGLGVVESQLARDLCHAFDCVG